MKISVSPLEKKPMLAEMLDKDEEESKGVVEEYNN